MAKLALVYGMRLLPVEELGEVREATVVLKNGKTARVAMHLIEGSKEEIEDTFRQSIDAFFEIYPEIWGGGRTIGSRRTCARSDELADMGRSNAAPLHRTKALVD